MSAKKNQSSGKHRSEEEELSPRERLMRGMSHPLRYQVLTLLNDREWSPNELANHLAEGLSQVSYHVKVLRDFKLIELTRTEPRRGALEHFYRATERTIIGMDMAKEIPKTGRQLLIGGILEEVNDDVNESIKAELYDSRDDYHVVRIPMWVDEKGCGDLHALGDNYINDVLGVAGESAERLAEGDESEGMGVTAVLLVFRSSQAEREKRSLRKPRKKAPKKKRRARRNS